MKTLVVSIAMVLAIPLVACATPQLFPPDAVKDVAQDVEFGVLKAQPDTFKGRAVMLAGRIVAAEKVNNGTLLLVKRLPVVEHPAYGPVETGATTGEKFAVLYPGKVDSEGLWFGNKLIVVAVVQGKQDVSIQDGIPRLEPYVLARCMHIWKTGEYGSYDISDFPHVVDGYYPLPEETYCAK